MSPGWGEGEVIAKTERMSAAEWLGLVFSLQSIKPAAANGAGYSGIIVRCYEGLFLSVSS